jgi:hypothetical protein
VLDYTPFSKEIRVQNLKTKEIELVSVSKTVRIL